MIRLGLADLPPALKQALETLCRERSDLAMVDGGQALPAGTNVKIVFLTGAGSGGVDYRVASTPAEEADFVVDGGDDPARTLRILRQHLKVVEALDAVKTGSTTPGELQHLVKRLRPSVVWIIGNSRSGKSIIAEQGFAPAGFEIIGSSEFHRRNLPHFAERFANIKDPAENKKAIEEFSAASTAHLAAFPHDNIDFMAARLLRSGKPCVIEGARNPYEFSSLFMPHKDLVFFLDRSAIEKYDTQPERSLPVLEATVRHLRGAGFIRPGQAFSITFQTGGYKVFAMGEVEDAPEGGVPEGTFKDDYEIIRALGPVVAGLVRKAAPELF